jgi:hypothetical protein
VGEDQAQARRGVGQHPPGAAGAEAEVDEDRQAELLAPPRDPDRRGQRPAVPVRVQLDAEHAGQVAPALELIEADPGPRVEEDPADEAVGVSGDHLGDRGVVGARVDGVDGAAQAQVAVVGDRGGGDGPGHRVARRPQQASHHRQESGRGRRQRVVHARDQRDPVEATGVHLGDHRRDVEHARLVVGVDIDHRHPASMPGRGPGR